MTTVPFVVLLGAAELANSVLPKSELLSLYGLGLLVFPVGRFVTLLPVYLFEQLSHIKHIQSGYFSQKKSFIQCLSLGAHTNRPRYYIGDTTR